MNVVMRHNHTTIVLQIARPDALVSTRFLREKPRYTFGSQPCSYSRLQSASASGLSMMCPLAGSV